MRSPFMRFKRGHRVSLALQAVSDRCGWLDGSNDGQKKEVESFQLEIGGVRRRLITNQIKIFCDNCS